MIQTLIKYRKNNVYAFIPFCFLIVVILSIHNKKTGSNVLKPSKIKVFRLFCFFGFSLTSISDIYEAKNAYKRLKYKEKWDFKKLHTLILFLFFPYLIYNNIKMLINALESTKTKIFYFATLYLYAISIFFSLYLKHPYKNFWNPYIS